LNNGNNIKPNIEDRKINEQYGINSPFHQPVNKSSIPTIAGILLIIAGVVAILSWMPFVMGDDSLISFAVENMNMNLSREQVGDAFVLCGSIGIILSVFTLLGGVLAFKRMRWTLAIVCSVIGLLTIGQFLAASGLSLISLVLLIISKKEFQ